VSTNRVKTAYILNGIDRGNKFIPPEATTPAAAPPDTPRQNYTLRSSHLFPCSLKHLSSLLRGGVMWKLPTVQNR
jgi:hypothetical protein